MEITVLSFAGAINWVAQPCSRSNRRTLKLKNNQPKYPVTPGAKLRFKSARQPKTNNRQNQRERAGVIPAVEVPFGVFGLRLSPQRFHVGLLNWLLIVVPRSLAVSARPLYGRVELFAVPGRG